MRPIVKKKIGESLLVDNIEQKVTEEYIPYQEAKPLLVSNLGCFCSYCEDAYHQMRDLHVEHIQPKGLQQYKELEHRWENFLLSCATCNGTDNKGNKDVVLSEFYLPHRDNTFLGLSYLEGGVIDINHSLSDSAKKRVTNLLDLLGLNKLPSQSKPGDKRWKKRAEDWKLAERYLSKFREGKCDIDVIVDLVLSRGGFSIWYTLFKEYDTVRKALIDNFPGTSIDCFDANNKFAPIAREL